MKLSPWTYLVIALSLGLIVLSLGLFYFFLPNSTEAAQQRTYAEQLRAEAAKLPQAEKRVADAKAEVDRIATEWQAVVEAKTPPASREAGGISLAANRWQLTVDTRDWWKDVQRAVNSQVKSGGVTVVQGPVVPAPPQEASQLVESYFNYPAFRFPVSIFNLGTVTVRGTYAEIEQNVRSWNSMPNYLALVDGLTIQGTSPELTAAYNLTLVAFIRGDVVSPAVPEGAGGGAAPGFGGAPGGVPGFGGPPPGVGFGGPGARFPGAPPGVGGLPEER